MNVQQAVLEINQTSLEERLWAIENILESLKIEMTSRSNMVNNSDKQNASVVANELQQALDEGRASGICYDFDPKEHLQKIKASISVLS